MKKIRFAALIITLGIFLPVFSSCAGKEPYSKTYYEYFDTVSTVYSYSRESKKDFQNNSDFIEGQLKEYHRLFDIYREYSGMNNLKTLNDNAGVSEVKVDRKIIDFLSYAKEMYLLTDGEINVAMGSVLSLWHESRDRANKNPESASLPHIQALKSAAEHISFDSIIIDEGNSTVFISDPDTKIDPGALGKGYATEKIAEALEEKGVSSYVLNFGGNIRIIGSKPNGSGWITGITNPKDKDAYALRVNLSDTSCVTSGNYERFYTVDGKNYHHIIDKDTLLPAEYFDSVSVICKDSALADALSTALFCMPYEKGLEIADFVGADVIWIYSSGEIKTTESVKNIILN